MGLNYGSNKFIFNFIRKMSGKRLWGTESQFVPPVNYQFYNLTSSYLAVSNYITFMARKGGRTYYFHVFKFCPVAKNSLTDYVKLASSDKVVEVFKTQGHATMFLCPCLLLWVFPQITSKREKHNRIQTLV